MLNILLVDDEEEIREGMARRIPWQQLGFFKPITAENGIEALELAEKLRPDIIITDIQMTFMDGLEFIEQATKLLPASKFLVFSGYDHFEYAQKAVSLKVDKYLLKPFSADDLAKVLCEIKEKMEEEKAERLNTQRLQKRFEENISIFRDNFFISCLNGLNETERVLQQQRDFNLPEKISCRLVLFEFRGNYELTEASDRPFLSLAVKDIAIEQIRVFEEPLVFSYGENLVWLPISVTDEQITQITNEICATITSLGSLILAGISKRHLALIELKNAYIEAQSALDFSSHLDQRTTFAMIADDIPHHGSSISLNASDVEVRRLVNVLKYGDVEKISMCAKELFQQAQKQNLNRFEYTAFLSEWVGVLSRNCLLNETSEGETMIFRLSREMESKVGLPFEEGCRWFIDCCCQVSKILQKDIHQSSKGQIMQGLHYIAENFNDPDLTADSLSHYLHLNPAYFSVLFKKHTGKTFVSYLTEKRVKEAKELLENSDDKTYIIAEKVGYTESNYFSYVFKKATGHSPTRYRKLYTSEESL